MRSKKLQIMIVFVLAITLVGLLVYWHRGTQEQADALGSLNKTYSKYDKKIRAIRDDIENRRGEADQVEKPASVIVAFSEEDRELMERIVPALESRGLSATLVVKSKEQHDQQLLEDLKLKGWDVAFGGEIGEETDDFVENLKTVSEQYEQQMGRPVSAYFFNGKEYGKGSKLLYPHFEELSFKIGVAFSKDASVLNHGVNTDYGNEIEECQNVSLREDLETIESILEQVIEEESVVVLSDFGLDRQMEISEEEKLDHLEEVLDLIGQKQMEKGLSAGSVSTYLEALEDRDKKIEQRWKEFEEYEKQCQEKIEEVKREREAALEK